MLYWIFGHKLAVKIEQLKMPWTNLSIKHHLEFVGIYTCKQNNVT